MVFVRIPKFLNRFSGIRNFLYLKLRIRDFTAKAGRDSGLKVCAGGEMPKITLGITGLLEILGRDYGIEKPYWGPSIPWCQETYSGLKRKITDQFRFLRNCSPTPLLSQHFVLSDKQVLMLA